MVQVLFRVHTDSFSWDIPTRNRMFATSKLTTRFLCIVLRSPCTDLQCSTHSHQLHLHRIAVQQNIWTNYSKISQKKWPLQFKKDVQEIKIKTVTLSIKFLAQISQFVTADSKGRNVKEQKDKRNYYRINYNLACTRKACQPNGRTRAHFDLGRVCA